MAAPYEASKIKRLISDNIKLMSKLKVANQSLETSRRREKQLIGELQRVKVARDLEEADDEVFYEECNSELQPDCCGFCREFESSLKSDGVRDLDEYFRRNVDYKLCRFCDESRDCEWRARSRLGSSKSGTP